MQELVPEQVAGESLPENLPEAPSEIQEAVPETPQAPPPKLNRMKIISALFNGLGIGFLLGILWSLSEDAVIGGVIATLSSLLALFLGLNEKFLDPLKSIRIGAFGLAAVAGVMLGLYLRINEPFRPTLRDQMDQYLAIGYDSSEARGFISGDIKADSGRVKRQSTLLFSATVDLTDCSSLRDITPDWKRKELLNLRNLTLSDTWAEFADVFLEEFSDDEMVMNGMIAMRKCFCPEEGGSGSLKISTSDEIKALGPDNSLDDIETILESPESGVDWNSIATVIRIDFPDESQRKIMYLSVIKVLGHE